MAIPTLSVYCKRNFNGKVESCKQTTTLPDFQRTTYSFLEQRKFIKGDARESQNIKGQHMVSRRYRCAACHLSQFFTKNNLRIQKAREGVLLRLQLTSLGYFSLCHAIKRKTKFAFTIKALAILCVLYWQTKVK